ncbi:MAG: Hpt domain-containing protein [Treponema sp.]|jgi:two-component system sensor histidine kinase/response regulator|nr:Hpt domain-containing protein [Treponema sp.]
MAENEGKVYIDWNDGIKRVMNNTALYTKLLNKFKASAGVNAGNLSTALDAGDYEKAQTEAHTLKGIAGNLSLTELYKQALEVETQIKTRSVDPGAFESLNACFTETIASIDKAIAEHA